MALDPARVGMAPCTMIRSSNSCSFTTAERGPVQTYKIYVSKGRDRVNEIRSELFDFPEILDVFITGRPDSLVVVYQGRPRPAQWLRALRTAGYALPGRSRSGHRRHRPQSLAGPCADDHAAWDRRPDTSKNPASARPKDDVGSESYIHSDMMRYQLAVDLS